MKNKFAIVDIETTGGSYKNSKIIEIAIIRVENFEIVDTFSSLLDPGYSLSPAIVSLTGINDKDLESASSFRLIADRILDLTENAVFVAHNVKFDYSFVKEEFKKIGINWRCQHLCSAKIFKSLVPEIKHHNLDSLISYYNLSCESRHRAEPDARVIHDFFIKAKELYGEKFDSVISSQLRTVSWPDKLSHVKINDFPDGCGVYIFKDEEGVVLYVGKSNNIKARLISHFCDLAYKEIAMNHQVADIEIISTGSELAALLVESRLIKKLAPVYNRKLRKERRSVVAYEVEGETGHKQVRLLSDHTEIKDTSKILGVYSSEKAATRELTEFARVNKLCPVRMGLVKPGSKCFWREIELCDGACEEEYPAWKYNARFTQATSMMRVSKWPFEASIFIKDKNLNSEPVEVYLWTIIHDGSRKNFDWDEYLILRSYILGANRKKVEIYSQGMVRD